MIVIAELSDWHFLVLVPLVLVWIGIIGGFWFECSRVFSKARSRKTAGKEKRYYDAVAEELQNKQLAPGVWARALTETDGDEVRARARYIKLRVQQIAEEEKAKATQEWQQRAKEEKAKAAQERQQRAEKAARDKAKAAQEWQEQERERAAREWEDDL
jgi:signal transduction histidine kinase